MVGGIGHRTMLLGTVFIWFQRELNYVGCPDEIWLNVGKPEWKLILISTAGEFSTHETQISSLKSSPRML